MKQSVEDYCNLLVRSRLLAPEDVRALYQRWRREAGDQAAFVGRFAQWLVAGGQLTTYQASRLARGRAEGFFLDQYKVLDKISSGPQAGLYRAVHQLGQIVAIKVLSTGKARDARRAARFLNEARLALRLKHPNVVRTFQTGQTGGRFFLVTEHLEGETLDDVLRRRGRLPPAEAVRLVHQALLGLQHLHERGIIHRDLKPASLVLVGPPDATARALVKIVDIDLGRGLPEPDNSHPLVGSSDYRAPEQVQDPHTVDIRADIYSLGCVLYHALAGRPPAGTAPQPLRELNPAVPDGLQQIVNWMIAHDPAQRYPTPERAAQALQVFLAAGTEPAGVPGTDPRLRSYLSWLETNNRPGPPTEPTPADATSPREHSKRRTEEKLAVSTAPPDTFDVELVPFEQLPQAPARSRGVIELDRRDFLMLGAGAGGALFAVFFGWLLARMLRRTPEPVEDGGSAETP